MAKVEISNGAISNVGFFEHACRKLAVKALSPVLKSERTNSNHGIDKAEDILRNGNGLIVIINHFSLKDPPLAANEVFRHREMGSKKIIAPIAYHMDHRLYHVLGRLIGINFFPIVTENTMKKGRNNGRELFEGKGKSEYLKASLNLLRQGGIVILAPQGTRMPNLGQPDNLTVGTFMAGARKNGLDKYAFLFIGFGIKGLDDYSIKGIKGFNLLKRYTANIGACLTSKEILEKAGGNFRAVDEVIFEELRKVVPSNYR